jgi:hypothetical protein
MIDKSINSGGRGMLPLWGSMIFRKVAFLCALLIATALVCPAQAVAPAEPHIVTAGEILRGRFTQDRTLAGFAKPLRSTGDFALIPGRGLIWHTKIPFENITVIQPQGILVRTNAQETLRLSADRLPGLSHLYDVMSGAVGGNTAVLQTDFVVRHSKAGGAWQIILAPLHPDKPAMAQIKMLTVTGSHFVETIEIDKGGGDSDRLSFLEQAVTKGAPTAEEAALLGTMRK